MQGSKQESKDFSNTPPESGTPSSSSNLTAIVENDREFKAYIYQQLVELQPLLEADSQLAVLVHPERDTDTNDAAVTLVASVGEYRIETEGRDNDIYEAFTLAKRAMAEQLEEWQSSSIDTRKRDAEIQSYIEGHHLVH